MSLSPDQSNQHGDRMSGLYPRITGRRGQGVVKSAWNLQSIARIFGLLALVFCALYLVDLSEVQARLAETSIALLITMVGLHVVIILITSWRFARIFRALGAALPLRDAIRLTFGATLANLLLPTSVAGDAGRVWGIQQYGITLKSAVAIGVFDRVVGVAALGFVALLGAIIAPSLLPLWGIVGIFGVSAGIVLLLAVFLRRTKDGSALGDMRIWSLFGETAVLSIAAHLVSIVIAYSFLQSQPMTVDLGALFALFPAVLLAASVPISVGGWGSRELAAVGAFSMVGLDASTAVAMAFMFGVTQTIAAALGSAGFALKRFFRGAPSD